MKKTFYFLIFIALTLFKTSVSEAVVVVENPIVPGASGATCCLGEVWPNRANYWAQSFVAPADVIESLNFEMFPSLGPDGADFKVLLTETIRDSTGIRPTNVLFESDLITASWNGGSSVPIDVDFGALSIVANERYAFVLDAFSAADGLIGTAGMYTNEGILHKGEFFFLSAKSSGTREEHFAQDWSGFASTERDLVFNLTFSGNVVPSVVPEPATILLLGSGLLGLAFRRRKAA